MADAAEGLVSNPSPLPAAILYGTEGGSGDYVQFSWRSPAIRGLQSDCRYVNNNEQITCRSHARTLGANDGDGASFGSS